MGNDGEPKPAAVITGASSGIGRSMARLIAADGTFVVLVARSEAALAELAAEILAAGGRAAVLAIDLTSADTGRRIDAVLIEHGVHCDVLVNSAGFGLWGWTEELDTEEQLAMIDLNVRSLTELTVRFLPGMIARGRGGVLNVGSTAGFQPGPFMSVYYASKAYVRSFSLALSAELRETGVTVACLAPGPVDTAFIARARIQKSRIFRRMPQLSADDVALAGWRGFQAGRTMIVPGALNRLFAMLNPILPTALTLAALARLQRPKHHRSVKIRRP